jgi:hypothetical protein
LAQQAARALPHAGQPPPARAPQQPQEQRLGLVVARVGHRDRHRPFLLGDAAQERVALLPRRLLDPASLALGAGRHVGGARAQGHPEAAAQLAAERRVIRGRRPQAVVEVGGHHPEAAVAADGGEGVGERHRVCASGQARHHRLPGTRRSGAGKSPRHARQQERRPHVRVPPKQKDGGGAGT